MENQKPLNSHRIKQTGWIWVPSLYLAEGLPYVIVMTVSVIMYKRLGISNKNIALYTSWLYLPWVIKPLWSPVVDLLKTKRFWIVFMQFLIGATFLITVFLLSTSHFFLLSIAALWLMAFFSATHDIAVDGFYMLALNQKQVSFFMGIRTTCYRIAMISGQGLLVILAGYLEADKWHLTNGNIQVAWSITFFIPSLLFIIFCIYHYLMLPYPENKTTRNLKEKLNFFNQFFATFVAFFKKERIVVIIVFLMLYRFGEAQLLKLASPFLLDSPEAGGLGLSTEKVGFIYGTVGIISLILGGLLGGFAISKKGLKFWLWTMVAAINIPDLVYVYLAIVKPDSFLIINICVAFEQFGYGFGFTAYLMYMVYISQGTHSTAHYAICTGFMALGMMLPGMVSGAIQEMIGYGNFFIWVCISTIPGFILTSMIKLEPEFGKKSL